MKRNRDGYTPRQMRYVELLMNRTDETKKEMAIKAGYSHSVAHAVANRIENTEGYANARRDLSLAAGQKVLAVFHSLTQSKIDAMETSELLKAVSILSDAVSKLAPQDHIKQGRNDDVPNKLRTIVLQNVETQNITPEKKEEIVI